MTTTWQPSTVWGPPCGNPCVTTPVKQPLCDDSLLWPLLTTTLSMMYCGMMTTLCWPPYYDHCVTSLIPVWLYCVMTTEWQPLCDLPLYDEITLPWIKEIPMNFCSKLETYRQKIKAHETAQLMFSLKMLSMVRSISETMKTKRKYFVLKHLVTHKGSVVQISSWFNHTLVALRFSE